MPVFNRRRLAIFLIIIGILALGLGLWLLATLLWPKSQPQEQAQNRQVQVVQTQPAHQPQVLALPTNVQGTSTAQQVQGSQAPALQEGVRRAESVVSRIGSGTSQDGFMGYDDAMLYATPNFRNWLSQQQIALRQQHPSDGPLYGITTRVVSSNIVEGTADSAKVIVRIQDQKAIDAGDRANPTSIIYEQADVTLVKQADGTYLIDELAITPINP